MNGPSSAPFADRAVAKVFEAYPEPLKSSLLDLRALIFKIAGGLEGVGPLEEALRWGQPSYLTAKTKSGSMIRLDAVKDSTDRYALYFHCQTSPKDALIHCLSMALTYHRDKKI